MVVNVLCQSTIMWSHWSHFIEFCCKCMRHTACSATGSLFLCRRPPIAVSEASCFQVVCPWVRVSVHPGVHPVTNQWIEYQQTLVVDVFEGTELQINLLDFDDRGFKVKVTSRSDIWASYCCGRSHTHRHLGFKVSFIFICYDELVSSMFFAVKSQSWCTEQKCCCCCCHLFAGGGLAK